MHNSKLIQVLKTFSKKEIKQFREYTQSPFFNKNKNVIYLLEELRKFHPEFENKNLDAKIIFEKIYPGNEYDYFKIRNLTSDLLVVSMEFFKIISFQNNEHQNTLALLEQLRDRSLDKLFEKLFNSYYEKINSNSVRDEFYYSHMADLKNELKSYYSPKRPNSDFNLIQEQLDFELTNFLIKALDLYTIMLHEIKQNNYHFDLTMFDEVMMYLEKNKNTIAPVLKMFYLIILLHKDLEDDIFFELKEHYKKISDSLGFYEKYMCFLHMSAFCAWRYNNDCRTDFMKEHFYLSKENLESNTILLGKIMYMDFLNHVKIAGRVKEYNWAEKYIAKFKDQLNEEKESTLNFSYGFIEYMKGNRLKALDLLSQTNFPNFIIKVQVKILMLQICYEEGFYDQAVTMIDSFRHFLARENSIKENYKESFYDFMRITGELIRLKTSTGKNENKSDLKRLKDAAENSAQNQFGIKLWLFEMIRNF
ncbi:MAG: hypothetical protein WAT71_09940 [Ignavibacteria bacterium]